VTVPPRIKRIVRIALIVSGAGLCLLAAFALWTMAGYRTAVQGLTRGIGDTVFLSSDGQPWFRLDEQRHDVPLDAVAVDLQHAVVAVEDRRFYLHPGLDPIGIVRAGVRDLSPGARLEGASTLTQQLARTLFLSNARTIARKSREMAIAMLLEYELTKPQILELYLNRIYLSAGVYGVDTMSQHLFRKAARDVTLPEAALIAGLIQAPSALSPWSNYEGALQRSRVVLSQMRRAGFITAEEEQAARAVRPQVQPYRLSREGPSGWVKDYLRQEFRNSFGGDHPPDWKVKTTIDRRVQGAAEQAIAGGLTRLKTAKLEAAFVALDPQTGNILAMVGGADYQKSTFNRVTRSKRQPGSAFKPFVYSAALQHGFSPVSMLAGLNAVTAPGDPEWAPRNADHETQPDTLTLRDALIESNNAAAAELQQKIGSGVVLKLASDAGMPGLPDVPSLALGSGEVTPLELTTAFAVFPSGGQLPLPRAIVSVLDAEGTEVFAQPIVQSNVVSPDVAFQMVTMLRDVVDRGTGSAARALGVTGPVGGKTGTTDDYKDAWFVGFSGSVVAGVWVGFDQPAPIGAEAYAARVAVPIWADFMKRTAKMLPAKAFAVPPGVHTVELCSLSHALPVEGCPRYTEYFKTGDEVPDGLCPLHRTSVSERTAKVVDTFFRGLGSKIGGWFRKRK
jgi:penicillin-binding protein 1A